jgi:hypothetical protein
MKHKFIVSILSLVLYFASQSQNLVKNGSFEQIDFWDCVSGIPNPNNSSDIYGKPSFINYYYELNQPNTPVPFIPYGNSKLYSTLASNIHGTLCEQKCGAPNTTEGYKLPRTGNNLIFGGQGLGIHQLSQALIPGQQYVFECYYSASSNYNTTKPFATDIFNDTTKGFLIVSLHHNINITPYQIPANTNDQFFINNIFKIDSIGWTKISACFTVNDTIWAFNIRSNIFAFMDDIAIYPATNFNTTVSQTPCSSLVDFNVNGTNANFSYYYNFGDCKTMSTDANPITYDYYKSGTYISNIISKDTITNQYFCSTNTVVIESVKANFTLPETMVTEVEYTPTNTSIDATNYLWILNNNKLPNETISSNTIGNNELCLIASNTNSGCSDTVCKFFTLNECGKVTSANVFTPNFDKVNDAFYFFETEPCDTVTLKIYIYDRWGKEFYRYPNTVLSQIQPTQLTESTMRYSYKFWNGFSNNLGPKFADSGVYFFIIETKYLRKSGTIQVFH